MRAIRRVRLYGLFVLVAFAAIFTAWYVTFTSERERYLVGRNFRVLSTVATQMDSAIAAQEGMWRTFLRSSENLSSSVEAARNSVPSLALVERARLPSIGKLPSDVRLSIAPAPPSLAVVEGRDVRLHLPFTSGGRGPWTVPLAVDRFVAPIFDPVLGDGVFSTLVVAAPGGYVLHAIGQQSAELMRARLSSLQPARQGGLPFSVGGQDATKVPGFEEVASTAGVVDVVISGVEYKLFTQPCCLTTRFQDASGPTSEQQTSGLVIAGLVNRSEFRAKTREIPPTVLIACIALLLAALAGYPFLKIVLIGERQHAMRRDVILVVACGVFGIALLTIALLDMYAYTWLNTVRDQQLKGFAVELSRHVERELDAASVQLEQCRQSAWADVKALVPRWPPDWKIRTEIFANQKCLPVDTAGGNHAIRTPSYPSFSVFAVMDAEGMQRVKWSPDTWVPAPIDVSRRTYFNDVIARGHRDPEWWCMGPVPIRMYIVESIWAWTTTQPEAVVSMPTCDENYPVAVLAIPMSSLINPAIPGGFEFAVINDDGLVLFHSDPQRNTYENLFQETDQDRRLRAAVAAHSDEFVDLRYSGRSYRAYVQRLGDSAEDPSRRFENNWSVVTLGAKEPAWALRTEWLVVSLALLMVYMAPLTVMLAVFFWRGDWEWLWSDARRVQQYRRLIPFVLVLLAAGALALLFTEGDLLVLLTFALPIVGWLVSYRVLRTKPRHSIPVRDAHAEYTSLAVLLTLLTSVVPAAGFLSVGYGAQVRMYVKRAQLDLAVASSEHHAWRFREHPESVETDPNHGVFDPSFLFDSRLIDAQSQVRCEYDGRADESTLLARFIEVMPYLSERSVLTRELLHQHADDCSWSSNPAPARALVPTERHIRRANVGPGAAPGGASTAPEPPPPAGSRRELHLYASGGQSLIGVSSSEPRLLAALMHPEQTALGLWAVLGSLLIAGLAWAIVRFIETHICLMGVDQPLWSKIRLASSSGENLFVVCDSADRARLREGTHELELHRILSSTTPDQDWMRGLMELDQQEPGRPVLLADFAERLDDPDLTRRKLAWVEGLAADQTRSVIVLSSASPSMLDQTLRMRYRDGGAGDLQMLERWRAVLASFVVINWRGFESAAGSGRQSGTETASVAGRLASLVGGVRQAVEGIRLRGFWAWSTDRTDRSALDVLRAEAEADAFVSAICTSIEKQLYDSSLRLSPEQVLDEVTERTATWYRRLWKACTPDERVVLVEIGREGFVNYRSRLTVRRLLARGLVVKDPTFRLMNQTFRRFVLSPECQADVRAIEGAAGSSPWDELRIPFFVVLGGAALFVMLTQQELFNATITTLAALAGAMPVLVRSVGMMVGKRGDPEAEKA